jgi:3-methyladenine DNA glycosylase/8-oxoguanine DNA glycosylase
MSEACRYAAAEVFLRGHDDDCAALVDLVGPCRHDPKAVRKPYEALVRAIAYQQLTAKAGDAMIDRLKGLAGSVFPTPAQIVAFIPGNCAPAASPPRRPRLSRRSHEAHSAAWFQRVLPPTNWRTRR